MDLFRLYGRRSPDRPGAGHTRPVEQVCDDRHTDHRDDHVRVDRRAPADLTVLDDVCANRATAHSESTTSTLLALVVLTGAAASPAAHHRGGDDRETVPLVAV